MRTQLMSIISFGMATAGGCFYVIANIRELMGNTIYPINLVLNDSGFNLLFQILLFLMMQEVNLLIYKDFCHLGEIFMTSGCHNLSCKR